MKGTKKRVLYVLAALLTAIFAFACLVGFAACGDDEPVTTVPDGNDDGDDGDDGNEPVVTVVAVLSVDSMTVGYVIGDYTMELDTTDASLTLYSDGTGTFAGDVGGTASSYPIAYTTSGSSMTVSISGYDDVTGTITYDTDGTTILAVAFTSFTNITQDVTFAADGYTPAEDAAEVVAVLSAENVTINYGEGTLAASSVEMTLYDDGTGALDCAIYTMKYPYDCTYSINNTAMTVSISGFADAAGTITYASTGAITSVTFTSFAGASQSVTFTATSSVTKILIATLSANSFKVNIGTELDASADMYLYSDGTSLLDCDIYGSAYPYECTYTISETAISYLISYFNSPYSGTVSYGTDGSISTISFAEFTGATQNVTFTATVAV